MTDDAQLLAAYTRDRDPEGRPRQARPRDALGRPLAYGEVGVEPVSEEPLPPYETVASARALLDEGRPFSAHEVLEARWKDGPEEERPLWQGLAQLCVGITHLARGNTAGGLRLLEEIGAADVVLPELPALRGLEQTAYHHLDAHDHTLEVLERAIDVEADPGAIVGEQRAAAVRGLLSEPLADELQQQHAGLPVFRGDAADNRKISAAWMIDRCGWKGYRDGDAGVAASHALVLVNHGAATGGELLALARRVAESVQDRFGVGIEPEPKIIGASWQHA